mmetsp:Transcript_24780/g.58832  ORF Transcript_24780/g.58832 Transcript_24780/m.58832 type:complete len:225 (-) Transcript_24780:657-1331(-)
MVHTNAVSVPSSVPKPLIASFRQRTHKSTSGSSKAFIQFFQFPEKNHPSDSAAAFVMICSLTSPALSVSPNCWQRPCTLMPSTVPRTSTRHFSSYKASLQRCATLPRTSAWLSCSSDMPPSSAQAAKDGKGMFPVWAGSAFSMISSTSSLLGSSPLTNVSIMSISLLLTVPFPSKSKAWNWNLLATSVVEVSSTAFFRTVKVWGSLRCHLLAYKLLSSKYLYST